MPALDDPTQPTPGWRGENGSGSTRLFDDIGAHFQYATDYWYGTKLVRSKIARADEFVDAAHADTQPIRDRLSALGRDGGLEWRRARQELYVAYAERE